MLFHNSKNNSSSFVMKNEQVVRVLTSGLGLVYVHIQAAQGPWGLLLNFLKVGFRFQKSEFRIGHGHVYIRIKDPLVLIF